MNHTPSPPITSGKKALAMMDTVEQMKQGAAPAESPDAELIVLCEQHFAKLSAFNACPLDADESPYWRPYDDSFEAIFDWQPTTLEGFMAKASVAKLELQVFHDGRESVNSGGGRLAVKMVNDLIRLDGGVS